MAGIRVNTGAKRIEVNDNGDCIVLNFADSSFVDRFFAMYDRIRRRADEAVPQAEEIDAQHQAGSEDHIRAAAALYRKLHEDIAEDIDGFFGPDTCKKVFGDIVPSIELYDDFFQQLMPYFKEFGEERAKRLSKYSAARTGNV
ncbi:MAG: tail assembly chaperone protein [Caudoviricetes sp.]|nr:MAG: tail assembly chaperone protein [Caudoviricetes sp.]